MKKYFLPLYASFRCYEKSDFYMYTYAYGFRSTYDTYTLSGPLKLYVDYLEIPF